MDTKRNGKKVLSIFLAASMTIGLAACGGETKNADANANENVAGTEVAEISQEGNTGAAGYTITEENGNQELTMNQQPESSYWFPAQLLEWNASEDEDLIYNVSSVPLAKRVDIADLETVNATQNKDTRVMAISIMNSSTSGNAPHGLNKVEANTFSYWQYVDMLVYWGGSSGEGIIVPPSPDVVDAGHKNGVPVIGTVFMPQTAHGGKMEWLEDLLTKNEDGSYPVADKLIEVAQIYGFDGWFMNQETEGTEEEPLTAEHAARMQEFIQYYKKQAPELELVYYDSMTVDGEMDWQNALTEKNVSFLKDEEGNAVADDMFLNFWWTMEELSEDQLESLSAEKKDYYEKSLAALTETPLLKASEEFANEKGIDPYSLYAGIDVQAEGYNTDINWKWLENEEGGTRTSIGIYCPSWAYQSSDGIMQDFWKKENNMWVNTKGDPSAEMEYSDDRQWRGISNYVVERTAVTGFPFITNFSTGNGYSFFKNGEQVSALDWNNRSISDILPTYRYIIESEEGNNLTADFDVAEAYYGGTSIILRGSMAAGKQSDIKLYSTELSVTEPVTFTTTAKAKDATVNMDAVLTTEDGSEVVLKGDKPVGDAWTTVTYDTSELVGKTIKTISYRLSASEDVGGLQFRFGNITMTDNANPETSTISNVEVLGKEFDEDAMYAGVRLAWESDVPAEYYEVYRINQDQTKSLLGVSNNTSFYINTLPRTDETNNSTFEVVPVNNMLAEGTSAQVSMEWPDNSIPKAAFTADATLVAPGQTVTFTSLCSQNTEKVSWTLPGSDAETAEGETVTAVYAEEGAYSVTVKAENTSGEAEATQEAYIIVTENAAEGLTLLSGGAGTEADAYVNDNEAPQFAVDGDVTKKWCATGSAPHEITLDLGEVRAVSAVDVYHAQAGGEGADMNTKSYAIMVSEDGTSFTEVRSVTRNTEGTTHDTFAPVNARFVKLVVNKPTQGSDSAARIYEIEVYGLETTLE